MRMTDLADKFLSCDWGTTSFRLRLVSITEQIVLSEIQEKAGIKSIYEEALRGGANTQEGRAKFFERFLKEKINPLFSKQRPAKPLPLIISGMASSSVGWCELPHAKMPFSLDGAGMLSQKVKWSAPDFVGDTWLISGLASEYDIMRGEETEIIGLMSHPELIRYRARALVVLPGTHSKHVLIEDGAIIDFHTHMTGELFEVLGRHSLLRASVDLDHHTSDGTLSDANRAAFQEGVSWAGEHGLSAALFRVRTRAVLGRKSPEENTWFFSGLLIGGELAEIAYDTERPPVIVAATDPLSGLYELAFNVLGKPGNRVRVSPEHVEQATVRAHILFLQNIFRADPI
jgi:2-dehydro-3-deoxygalactonokinase